MEHAVPLKQTLRDLANNVRKHVPELDHDELAALMSERKDAVVIDSREPDERARGFIPGSVGIPRGVLERDIEKLGFGGTVSDADLARPVVCYCQGGSRSLLAADSLRQMGFTNVLSLEGGFGAWGESGKPVEIARR